MTRAERDAARLRRLDPEYRDAEYRDAENNRARIRREQQNVMIDGAGGPPNEGTTVVSSQRQRRLDRMYIRRQVTNNHRLARQRQQMHLVRVEWSD